MPHRLTTPLVCAALSALAALAVLAACRDTTGPAHDLAEAKARWRQTRPQSYAFTYGVSCFCLYAGPVVVDVRGDSVTAWRVLSTGTPALPNGIVPSTTIDRLFAALDSAVARHPARFDATYDRKYGYPTSVYIDFVENVADDEIGYSVSQFVPR
jgi:hypothetical protein